MLQTRNATLFNRTFKQHPESVGESYGQHAMVALSFSGQLFLAAGAALVHAIIPCLFEKTASRRIRALHARMERR